MLKVYHYRGCDTCRQALKYLDGRGIDYTPLAIRETPPNKAELKRMLACYDGEIKRLFNTAGQDYRALKIKDSIKEMTATAAIELLAGNGNLIKRPFAIDGDRGIVGFKVDAWDAYF